MLSNNKVHETQGPESTSRVALGQVVPWRSRGGCGGSAYVTRDWGREVRVRATSPTPPSASGCVWLHRLESLRLLHSGPTAGRRQRDGWEHHLCHVAKCKERWEGPFPGLHLRPGVRAPENSSPTRPGRTGRGSAGSRAPAVPQALRKPGAAPPTPGDTAVGERRVEAMQKPERAAQTPTGQGPGVGTGLCPRGQPGQ